MSNPKDITDKVRETTIQVSRELMDKGLLIEAGFASLMIMAYPNQTVGPQQRADLRRFFFAGAQHLFGSIMGGLDDGTEETEDDMRRMDLINKELQTFINEEMARLRGGVKTS